MKTFLINVVEKIERLRTIEIPASSREEAEDKALMMQSRWTDLKPSETHEDIYIDSIREQ